MKSEKELNDKSKPYLTTTFFSTKEFSKDNSTDDILNLADKLKEIIQSLITLICRFNFRTLKLILPILLIVKRHYKIRSV